MGKRSFWASPSFKLSKTSEQHCTLSILFFVVLPSCGHISFGRTQYFTFVSIRMIAQRYSLCKGAMHWIQLSEVYHKKDLANSVQDLKKKIFSLLPAIFVLIFSLKVYIQRKPCEIEQNHTSHRKQPQNKSK